MLCSGHFIIQTQTNYLALISNQKKLSGFNIIPKKISGFHMNTQKNYLTPNKIQSPPPLDIKWAAPYWIASIFYMYIDEGISERITGKQDAPSHSRHPAPSSQITKH